MFISFHHVIFKHWYQLEVLNQIELETKSEAKFFHESLLTHFGPMFLFHTKV